MQGKPDRKNATLLVHQRMDRNRDESTFSLLQLRLRRSPLARRLVPAVRVGRSDVGATTKMDSLAGPGRLEDSLHHVFRGSVAMISKGEEEVYLPGWSKRQSSGLRPSVVWLHSFSPGDSVGQRFQCFTAHGLKTTDRYLDHKLHLAGSPSALLSFKQILDERIVDMSSVMEGSPPQESLRKK